jgi:hypothetical protein
MASKKGKTRNLIIYGVLDVRSVRAGDVNSLLALR